MILSSQSLKFYKDGQFYKANLSCDFFWLTQHSFSSSFKISIDRSDRIEKWRQVVYSDFIQTKPLEYKQQLLHWYKFMLIILFLFSKVKFCLYKLTTNYILLIVFIFLCYLFIPIRSFFFSSIWCIFEHTQWYQKLWLTNWIC